MGAAGMGVRFGSRGHETANPQTSTLTLNLNLNPKAETKKTRILHRNAQLLSPAALPQLLNPRLQCLGLLRLRIGA